MHVDAPESVPTSPEGGAPIDAVVDPRTRRLCFGGVGFDLQWEAGHDFALLDADRGACLPGLHAGGEPVAGHVRCMIHWGNEDILGPVEVRDAGPGVRAFSGLGTRGELHDLGGGRYRAGLTVNPRQRGCGSALRLLAGLVLESSGGLSLHAAAVVIDGGAVLFTGPSGAGKSTACELSTGERCLAYDHVALTPSADGYSAWRIPMGEAASLPLTADPVLPLRGILCVQRGEISPGIRPSDAAQVLFDVRRAIDVADPSAQAEAARLDAAHRLAQRIPVARVETVLGKPIGPLLRDWLAAEADRG